MFRFMQEPSSGSQSQCLAKITGMVPLCLSICALLVSWRHTTRRHMPTITLATHISTSTVEPYL